MTRFADFFRLRKMNENMITTGLKECLVMKLLNLLFSQWRSVTSNMKTSTCKWNITQFGIRCLVVGKENTDISHLNNPLLSFLLFLRRSSYFQTDLHSTRGAVKAVAVWWPRILFEHIKSVVVSASQWDWECWCSVWNISSPVMLTCRSAWARCPVTWYQTGP